MLLIHSFKKVTYHHGKRYVKERILIEQEQDGNFTYFDDGHLILQNDFNFKFKNLLDDEVYTLYSYEKENHQS